MPELPEVETIRAGLVPRLEGKRLSDIEYNWPKKVYGEPEKLVGHAVTAVRRRGKVLIIEFGQLALLFHLKMTGQIILRHDAETELAGGHPIPTFSTELPNKTTRATLRFSGNLTLYFNDLRKFGWLKEMPSAQIAEEPLLKTMGPEPLSAAFNTKYLAEALAKRGGPIKAILLDQTLVAGLGNIYADEALWYAQLHPLRPAKSLTAAEVAKLHQAIRQAIRLGIAHRGSSYSAYVTVEGERGTYLHHAKAYHVEKCDRCGGSIEKKKIAGRTAHFCPHCQRL